MHAYIYAHTDTGTDTDTYTDTYTCISPCCELGDLEFEVGSSIRVAVKEVSFRKKEKFTEAKKESETVSESLAELKAKMMIVGSIAQDGLGCSSWWD